MKKKDDDEKTKHQECKEKQNKYKRGNLSINTLRCRNWSEENEKGLLHLVLQFARIRSSLYYFIHFSDTDFFFIRFLLPHSPWVNETNEIYFIFYFHFICALSIAHIP